MSLWEVLEEMTGQADTAVVALAEAEDVVALVEEDLHLVEGVALTGVEIEAAERCLKPLAVTAEKNVRYLLDLRMESLFTAVSVLRKWEMATDAILQETISGHLHRF